MVMTAYARASRSNAPHRGGVIAYQKHLRYGGHRLIDVARRTCRRGIELHTPYRKLARLMRMVPCRGRVLKLPPARSLMLVRGGKACDVHGPECRVFWMVYYGCPSRWCFSRPQQGRGMIPVT